MNKHTITAGILLALCGLLASGCTSTEKAPTAADSYAFDAAAINHADTVGIERVSGARGEHLGWVRTERAGTEGGTYQVYLDPDMNTVAYNVNSGQHFRPNGSSLEHVGSEDRPRGLARSFGRRAEDIVVEPSSHRALAASGPLSGTADPVEIGGSGGDDDDDDDDDDE